MSSSKLYVYAGWACAAALVLFGSRVFVHDVVHSETKPEKPGFEVAAAVDDGGHGGSDTGAEVVVAPIAQRLTTASVEAGQKAARPCLACHTFEQGGPNKVGPNLYAIVESDIGKRPSFAYSPAMAGHGGKWTYADLDEFLANPKGDIPGTKMTFAGIRKPEDRANLIMYLRSLAPAPAPLPQ